MNKICVKTIIFVSFIIFFVGYIACDIGKVTTIIYKEKKNSEYMNAIIGVDIGRFIRFKLKGIVKRKIVLSLSFRNLCKILFFM